MGMYKKDKKGSIIASIYSLLNFAMYLIICLISVCLIWKYIDSLILCIILTIFVIVGNVYFEKYVLIILVNSLVSFAIKIAAKMFGK